MFEPWFQLDAFLIFILKMRNEIHLLIDQMRIAQKVLAPCSHFSCHYCVQENIVMCSFDPTDFFLENMAFLWRRRQWWQDRA